jgi:hypothetical protein
MHVINHSASAPTPHLTHLRLRTNCLSTNTTSGSATRSTPRASAHIAACATADATGSRSSGGGHRSGWPCPATLDTPALCAPAPAPCADTAAVWGTPGEPSQPLLCAPSEGDESSHSAQHLPNASQADPCRTSGASFAPTTCSTSASAAAMLSRCACCGASGQQATMSGATRTMVEMPCSLEL